MRLGLLGIAIVTLLIGARAQAFDFDDVVQRAEELAAKPFQPPAQIPAFLRELSFEQYQGIRFKPERSLWREERSRFQVMWVPPGLYFDHAVTIHVVDGQGVRTVAYRKDDFTYDSAEVEKRIPANLGLAGFKLTYPFADPDIPNQFLVFAGASYFRGVGKDNAFGLSARGIAVNTGLPAGEEFPSFVEYWLVRPGPAAKAMTFCALLDGKSLTGAYRFTARPGETTRLDVEAVLFPRSGIAQLGIAPLTSMFFYGANTGRPAGEWRPQVHDSDGLLVHNGATGERLWRPLINPTQLQINSFQTENVRGFGLLQRQTRFGDYEDLGARYEMRPSAWVQARGDWGKGDVVLVQLPTRDETNDNIVAFWKPAEPVQAKKPLRFSYTLSFGGPQVAGEPAGTALRTFVGRGDIVGGGRVKGSYRVIVDFAGGELSRLPPQTPVTATVTADQNGTVIEHFVQYAEPFQGWRLSILAKPAAGKPLALRAFLSADGKTLTETWNYELPVSDQVK